jgi:hypothetical protein
MLLRLRLKEKRKRWHNLCLIVEYHEMDTQSIFINVIIKAFGVCERITFDAFMAHSFKLWSSELCYCVVRLFFFYQSFGGTYRIRCLSLIWWSH